MIVVGTSVTPEPYPGHFGHDGIGHSRHILEEAFANKGIIWYTEAQVTHAKENAVVLAGQRHITSKFTMLVPPYPR